MLEPIMIALIKSTLSNMVSVLTSKKKLEQRIIALEKQILSIKLKDLLGFKVECTWLNESMYYEIEDFEKGFDRLQLRVLLAQEDLLILPFSYWGSCDSVKYEHWIFLTDLLHSHYEHPDRHKLSEFFNLPLIG